MSEKPIFFMIMLFAVFILIAVILTSVVVLTVQNPTSGFYLNKQNTNTDLTFYLIVIFLIVGLLLWGWRASMS